MIWAGFKRPSLPGALLTAVLVSYHHVISDTSLLALPLGLCFCAGRTRTSRRNILGLLACVTYLGLPALLLAGTQFSLLTIPVLALFAVWDGTYWSPYEVGHSNSCLQKDTNLRAPAADQ
jgi:hypothetical protein